jgi:putative flavoprotein involved in K+ transport
VANVIWCTGFRTDFSWVDIPEAFGRSGEPIQDRGVFTAAPGLYCVGQEFQYSFASDILPGIGRDAAYVVRQIARRADLRRVDSEDTVLRRDAAELGMG